MPVYEYECGVCCYRFDRRQRFDDEPVSVCPQCQGKSRRVLHSVPVFFKGSGFYSTDHGRGSQGASSVKKEEKPAEKKESSEDASPKDKA